MNHRDDAGAEPAVRSRGRTGPNRSYVVQCASDFRDAVLDLAKRKGVNVGSLARAVLLVLPDEAIRMWPDPGEPDSEDRETVTLKSGPGTGREWRRKPRLQVRMRAGLETADIRRALALALAIDSGELALRLEQGCGPGAEEQLALARAESARLRKLLRAAVPDPVPNAVHGRSDALHVLGFAPGARPDAEAVGRRYRSLAAIHHPDSSSGDHARMSQLNAAVRILRRG